MSSAHVTKVNMIAAQLLMAALMIKRLEPEQALAIYGASKCVQAIAERLTARSDVAVVAVALADLVCLIPTCHALNLIASEAD